MAASWASDDFRLRALVFRQPAKRSGSLSPSTGPRPAARVLHMNDTTPSPCPACGTTGASLITRRVDLGRAPELIDRLLGDAPPTCRCGASLALTSPLLVVDHTRRWWLAAYPADGQSGWRTLEAAISVPPGWTARLVFGPDALREKLFVLHRQLDDRVIEALKLSLWRHVAARLRLVDVDDEVLRFRGRAPELLIDVARGRYDEVRDQETALAAVSGGPWVDAGRLHVG